MRFTQELLNTLLSSFDNKETLLKWLKKLEYAIDNANVSFVESIAIEGNDVGNAFRVVINFAGGESIASNYFSVTETFLTPAQRDAINSGIDATKVEQISTNSQAIVSLNNTKQDNLSQEQLNNINSVPTKQDALTQEQLNAVNSGIDATKVAQIGTNSQAIVTLNSTKQDNLSQEQLNNISNVPAKQDALTQIQLDAVNSGINATKVTMFNTTAKKGRGTLFGITQDMNIGTSDTPVINIEQRRRNPNYDFVVNQTHDGIIVPQGVHQIKITSIMCYLPKSNNESFNNVIKRNGTDIGDRQAFIYVQAPIADIRTSLTNVAISNVDAGDVISFVTKAPTTDVNNPAKLQYYSTHFIIEVLETTEES